MKLMSKPLFWGQIFETEILMDLRFLRPPDSKNHILSCSSEYLHACVCLLSPFFKKKILAKTKNLVFCI